MVRAVQPDFSTMATSSGGINMLTYILCLIIFAVAVASIFFAERDFLRALRRDLQKNYKEAIYYYAVATVSSCFFKDICREQIVSLWKTHGPFDYSDLYNSAATTKDHESFISREAIMEIIKNFSVTT